MTSLPAKVTRDVVVDLLPLYLAGEASADSVALVDAYLADDPALAASIRADAAATLFNASDLPRPDLELRTLRRARRILTAQRWLFALAITFTALGLSVDVPIRGGTVTEVHLALRDRPLPFSLLLAAAVVCWFSYGAVRRSLRT